MSSTLMLHSVEVALGACVVGLFFGVMIALALITAGTKLRRMGLVAGAITLALPPFLQASCWLELTAAWRTRIGAEAASQSMLPFTALVLGLGLWPLTLFLVLGAWQRVQPSVLEAESHLRGLTLIRWVLLPAARRAVALATVLTLSLAVANFTVPTLFQVRVFTEEFWIRYSTQFDLQGALLATWPLWLVPVLIGWSFRGRDAVWPRESAGLSPRLLAQRLGLGWIWSARLAGVLVIAASVVLPLLQLVANARTWTELPGAFGAAGLATRNSFLASVITAAVVVGVSVAWRSRTTAFFARTSWIFFLLPGVFLAVGLILTLNRPAFSWLYGSFGLVWLALNLRYFAPAWSGIEAARRSEDTSLRESAMLLGATRWQQFWLISWPQSGRAILAAGYAVYLLCLWDIETLVLIQPPGGETLALRIFNLLHYGHASQVNALCVVAIALALLPLVAFWVGRNVLTRLGGRGALSRYSYLNLSALAGALGFGFAMTGCSNSNDDRESTLALSSHFFSGVQVIGSRGVAPGQFNKPRSLTCDRSDNLYVADITGRIQKFDPDGHFLLQWQMPETAIGKAKGMGLDPAGNIIVVEPHYQRVNHFDGSGHLMAQWGRRGTNAGEFILPRCVAVNSAGEYFLGEYTQVERVQKFYLASEPGHTVSSGSVTNIAYQLLESWGRPGQGNGDFNRPEGIAIGPRDEVYVADSCNHRIEVFDRAGRFLRAHGQGGAKPGEFSFPYDLRVDASGRQFICEFGNSRVSIFDAADHLVETIGRPGREPGEFSNPWAICFDSKGNLYVADSQNHRVQKLIRRPRTLAGL